MDAIQRSISAARRRLFIQTWLTATGWLLLAGLATAGAIVLAQRLLALPLHPYIYIAVAALVVVIGPIIAWAKQPDARGVATLIDERLGLKDRLGTALFVSRLKPNAFTEHVVHDATEAASHAKLRDALPIRLTRIWAWVPPVTAIVALLALMLPTLDLAGFAQQRQREAIEQAQAQSQQQEIIRVINAVQQTRVRDGNTSDADPLDALRELAQLTERDLRNPQMRREAAARLSEVQERIANAQQQKERQFQPIQNMMSQLDPGMNGPADQFADALRRGDFKAAQQALDKLADSIDQLSDDEKQALQQQLQNMAQQLQQLAQQQQQQQQQAQQQLQQAAQQGGLTQQQTQQYQNGQMSQQQLQQAIQQQLQQQGMSQQQAQQQAQQLAQQMQQAMQQQQSAGQCQNTGSNMSQSMQQMAQSLQQGQQGQQFQPATQGTQQQLSQMAQMQQQLQQYQQSQQQVQQTMQQMAGQQQGQQNQSGQGQGQGQGQQTAMQQQPGGGVGGVKAGTGDGGNPMGSMSQMTGHTTTAELADTQGQGKVIASWLEHGEMTAGDPIVEFDHAVTEARQSAEQAVTEDRVPRRYHGSIKDYFNQLPATPEQVTKPATPRAPR